MRIRRHEGNGYESRDLSMSFHDDSLPIDQSSGTVDFQKIKVGVKQLEDAVIDFPLKKANRNYADKDFILNALKKILMVILFSVLFYIKFINKINFNINI